MCMRSRHSVPCYHLWNVFWGGADSGVGVFGNPGAGLSIQEFAVSVGFRQRSVLGRGMNVCACR